MTERIWKVIAGDAQHKLKLAEDLEIQCYVLENHERVIAELGLTTAIGFSRGKPSNSNCSEEIDENDSSPKKGKNTTQAAHENPRFTIGAWLFPYLTPKTLDDLNSPIKFKSGTLSYGYPATMLVDIANAVTNAFMDDATTIRQLRIVKNAQRILSSCAKVGINALIDEVTGYQALRDDQELQKFFDVFLNEKPADWKKTYPDEYYQQIYRLNGWEYPPKWKNHPQIVAYWTINAVYDRLAPQLTPELERRNPMSLSGSRYYNHHQFLSDAQGYPQLEKHLYAITSLMRTCNNWQEFERLANRAFPIPGTNMEMIFPHNDPNNLPN